MLERQTGVLHACEAETSMIMAVDGADVDEEILPQCQGVLIPGAAAIHGVNPAVYRWRQLGTRSLNGVIGDASVATADKGEQLLTAIAERLAQTLRTPELWSAPI